MGAVLWGFLMLSALALAVLAVAQAVLDLVVLDLDLGVDLVLELVLGVPLVLVLLAVVLAVVLVLLAPVLVLVLVDYKVRDYKAKAKGYKVCRVYKGYSAADLSLSYIISVGLGLDTWILGWIDRRCIAYRLSLSTPSTTRDYPCYCHYQYQYQYQKPPTPPISALVQGSP